MLRFFIEYTDVQPLELDSSVAGGIRGEAVAPDASFFSPGEGVIAFLVGACQSRAVGASLTWPYRHD